MTQATAPASASWFQSIPKGVAVTASTGAAVASIITALHTYGVIGRAESHQALGNIGAAWVRVRPAVDTATAIGDTILFAATVADKKGSILVGATPVWTTGDSSVARVLGDGSVIARGAGSTTINVVVGSVSSSVRVVVSPQVARVAVEGVDAAGELREGEQLHLRARAVDARGHLVAGRGATWASDDTTVVAVDPRGIVTGESAGRGQLTVKVDGASAVVPVVVVSTATALDPVAGAGQHALAGSALPQPVVVRATNRRGAPAAGKLVTFRVQPGQGLVEPATATTDADGRARTHWTLGEVAGVQQLLATVEQLDSTLAIAADADPVARNTRVAVLAEQVRARAGSVVAESIGVRVTDSLGRALSQVPVRWDAGDGRAEAVDARTDSTGVARGRWTLGAATGTQRLRAFVGHADSRIPPVTVVGVALAGPVARAAVTAGDRQQAAAGRALPAAVVIRVTDVGGNGVAGARVALGPSAGTVPDSAMVTDSLGYLRTRWTMGHSAGDATLAARVEGLEKPLKVGAHATAGAPANLTFDDVPATGARAGARPILARVADLYGNPVPEAAVTFSARSGTVSPARAVTDARGRVALRWTMGTRGGDQKLTGTVRGTDVSGAYLAQAPVAAGRKR